MIPKPKTCCRNYRVAGWGTSTVMPMDWRVPLVISACLLSTQWGCKRKDKPAPQQPAVQDISQLISNLMQQGENEASPEPYERAEQILEQAIKANPEDDELYVQLADVLKEEHVTMNHAMDSENSDPAEAIPPERIRVLLEKAIAINPDNGQAYRIMANYLRSTTNPGAALEYYLKLEEMDPEDLSVRVQIGVTYLAMQQSSKAKVQFEKALNEAKTRGQKNFEQQALDGLAAVAQMEGKSDKAKDFYLKSVATGQATACSHHALGQLYSGLGKFKKGARFMAKAAEFEPEREDLQLRAAVLTFLAYDFMSSRKYCDRIISGTSQEKLTWTHNISGFLLLLEQKYIEANQAFEKVLEADPRDPGASVGKGHLAIINKDYQGARSLLRRHADLIQTSEPRRGYNFLVVKMAALGMAWLLSNQAKHTEALKYFDKILSKAKADLFALLGKGSSLTALGRLEEAATAFKEVLEIDPGNQYGLAELGLVKLNSGDIEGAKEAFTKARASGGQKYTCPYEGLGLVYLKQGKIEKAKENFEKAIEINPNIEYKKFNELAKIYIKQGRRGKAISLLKRSAKNYPYDPEAKRLLQKLLVAPLQK